MSEEIPIPMHMLTDGINAFPMPEIKSLEGLGLNAVIIHIMDDGRLCLALAVKDEEHKDRLTDLAYEIVLHGIAPSP